LRNAFNGDNIAAHFKRPRYTYLEALDNTDGENGRFAVPFAFAPQRYGYNIIKLYPEAGSNTIKVRFRGDVQTKNNIQNYTKRLNLEPVTACMFDDPGSDWRYGIVMASASGTAARYSDLKRASDGNPDITIDVRSGETPYLVVAAAPTKYHKIKWDQFYYTIYRFPYMVEITGAKPEGFQPQSTSGGSRHSNGGGFVASTAQAAVTAYVGPNARVLGNARVNNNARIEGRAVVQGGTVSGNAIVKDYAFVNAGTISGSAVISEGANIWGGTITDNARVDGAANLHNNNISLTGNSRIGGVCWVGEAAKLSGTAQLLGDGEVYGVSASSGVYHGLVDAGVIGNNQHGGNLTAPPTEATKPRSMMWVEGSTGTVNAGAAKNLNKFTFNNKGVFRYSFDAGAAAKSARLKLFDSKGRVLKTVRLGGSYGAVDTRVNTAAQVIFWKVELDGRIADQGRIKAVK
ncbi:MAG: DUF6055 domain-containing protein, partial [Chitinispirillales bacterium]|nr:DUF6055 domain-containing protein [Chitinispirillales bacterium]